MKVLLVTNMFPTNKKPFFGIFVSEQMNELIKVYNVQFDVYFIDGRKSKLNYIKGIFAVNYKLMCTKYDCIHIHYSYSGLFLIFNPFIQTPKIVTMHGSDVNSSNFISMLITKQVASLANHVIVLNDKMKQKLSAYKNKISILGCGVDLKTFYPINKTINQKVRIGFPSSKNRPEKNYKLFQEIVGLVSNEFELEVVEIINMTREQVNIALNQLDLLIMTSLNEGSPQVVKECLATNTPIVSTNVGDVAYLLDGVTNCYVIDSYEAKKFIEPIKKILSVERQIRVSNGRERLIKIGLDQESVAKTIFSLYTKLQRKTNV